MYTRVDVVIVDDVVVVVLNDGDGCEQEERE